MSVPEGWEKHPIGKICKSIVPGRNKPKSFDGTIPWITTPDIQGRYLPSKAQRNFISETAIKESGAKIVPAGGVVIAAVGELGLTAIAAEPIVLNQQLHAFICTDNIYNEYLAYWLETQKPYMDSVASKTTIPYMNKSNCESIPVIFPLLPEQKKIVRILSTWDRAIEVTEKLLNNSQQQKKALMQLLLTGKKRLPGFSGEWKIGYLGDICSFKGGSAFKEAYQGKNKGELPFIKVSDMNLPLNNVYINEANNWISATEAKHMKAKPFPKGAVVFAKVGAALLLNRRRILVRDTVIDNNMMAAIPSIYSDTQYLYQLMQMIDFAKFVQEGAVPSVNQSDLARFKIHLPNLSEQQAIASVLSTADKEIEVLEQKLGCLRQEKKALMQQLLTGKRRVKVDEAEVPEKEAARA